MRRAIGDDRTGTVYMNRADYLDPALAWAGQESAAVYAVRVGYEHLTRPKSFHLEQDELTMGYVQSVLQPDEASVYDQAVVGDVHPGLMSSRSVVGVRRHAIRRSTDHAVSSPSRLSHRGRMVRALDDGNRDHDKRIILKRLHPPRYARDEHREGRERRREAIAARRLLTTATSSCAAPARLRADAQDRQPAQFRSHVTAS